MSSTAGKVRSQSNITINWFSSNAIKSRPLHGYVQELSSLPFDRSKCGGILRVDKYLPFLPLKIQNFLESAAKIEIFVDIYALSFYRSKMIFDQPNCLDMYKLFCLGPNHFGQVQIRLSGLIHRELKIRWSYRSRGNL